MTAIRMRKGDLVTHVYNDPETIADAERKGFLPVDAKATGAKPADEAGGETDATMSETSVESPGDEMSAEGETETGGEETVETPRRRGKG